MRRFFLLVALVLMTVGSVRSAAACGGLFCTTTPVDQAVERIIFALDSANEEITAYVQINYTGNSDSFAWVVPVPNNPKVDVADVASFTELSNLTRVNFNFPPPPSCDARNGRLMSVGSALDGHSSGGFPIEAEPTIDVYQQSSVGPYDFAVIGGENPSELVRWLRDNGYRITTDMEPLIKVYTDEGMLFLAMKLSGGNNVQDIQPVKMRYKASQPMIPIRLTAVAANPNMGILVWIFADEPMKPANMKALPIDPNQIALTSFSSNNYNTVRGDAIDTVAGHGFVTEYMQATTKLLADDPELVALKTNYRYITRLYTEMSPDEMTLDPTFVGDPNLPTVSNSYDFSNRPSPYECTSYGLDLKSVERQQFEARWGMSQWWFCMVVLGFVGLAWWTIVWVRERRLEAEG